MSRQNELRVFISSTFRDLQEEREHLVKKIFPEIRALCRERGVTFTEVDLRWGLTEENAILGQVIRTCLDEVDRCRPYFIGMIGNRYGWVPEFHEVLMDQELLQKYPWVEEVALEGASVTEMEFIHGVFDAPTGESAGPYAFFYHRAGNDAEGDRPEKLAALVERARNTGHPFRDFDAVESLGELVRDDLIGMINEYWPVDEAPSPIDLERRAHAAFSASRTRAYIPNSHTIKEFSQWSAEGEKPLIVQGESGLGKSSLVAYLTDLYRKRNPHAFVIEHYVGASDQSGSALAIMRHVIEEICERFSIDEKVPETKDELEKSFAAWLFRAEHLAAESDTTIYILLDALNQLGEYGRRLAWLPEVIPAGVKLVLSTTPGETEDRLLAQEWDRLPVTPLEDERIRQSIVVRYLGEFKKGIAPDQLRRITGDPLASSPLFLRVVAEELRLHGEHETIDDEIERYTGLENLLEIFLHVLERIERDHGEQNVRSFLSLIALSRSGLNETELLELSALNRLELSRLLLAFDYHLIRRNGLLNFFHHYLQRAVEMRYLRDERAREEEMERMMEYFSRQELTQRSAREVLWGYRSLGETDRLAEHLSQLPVLHHLYKGEGIYEVQSAWRELAEQEIDVEECYRKRTREEFDRGISTPLQFAQINTVCRLLNSMGYWESLVAVGKEMVQVAEAVGQEPRAWETEILLADVYRRKGEHDKAMEVLQRLNLLYNDQGDRLGVAQVQTSMGIIHNIRGDYDRALEALEQARTIYEDGGVKRGSGIVIRSIGITYRIRGEFDRALASLQQARALHHDLGERSNVAIDLENLGTLYKMFRKHDEALEAYTQALTIHQELGEKSGSAAVLEGMAMLFYALGEYDRSMEYHQRALAMHRELGERSRVAVVMANIGNVLFKQGDHQAALAANQEGLDIFLELGEQARAASVMSSIGHLYCETKRYAHASEIFEEALIIYRRIGYDHGIVSGELNIGYLAFHQEEYVLGLPHLVSAAEYSLKMGDKQSRFRRVEDITKALLLLCEEEEKPAEELADLFPELREEVGGMAEGWRKILLSRADTFARECRGIAEEGDDQEWIDRAGELLVQVERARGEEES